ncbi:MAG TPA: hypothetical protein PK014_09985 [Thermoanaerobaculia bacterium]|nr:hypothetical protein [Thermoanaerobaculia bacterium]HUM30447.1 hypothetical protein [Thermoanaerobaculia bacterium]HXK68686.1 hypothetical protein [Thermoanaerobaculia bacterium]
MTEILKVNRSISFPRVIHLAEEVILDIPGSKILQRGERELRAALPTPQRFYKGQAEVRVTTRESEEDPQVHVEVSLSDLRITGSGKIVLFAGMLGVIPWILWPFFPGLIPMIPLGVLFLFFAWIAAGKRPHAFTEKMVGLRLRAALDETGSSEEQGRHAD